MWQPPKDNVKKRVGRGAGRGQEHQWPPIKECQEKMQELSGYHYHRNTVARFNAHPSVVGLVKKLKASVQEQFITKFQEKGLDWIEKNYDAAKALYDDKQYKEFGVFSRHALEHLLPAKVDLAALQVNVVNIRGPNQFAAIQEFLGGLSDPSRPGDYRGGIEERSESPRQLPPPGDAGDDADGTHVDGGGMANDAPVD